ncbi:MAG: 1-acyl-sn-glycerol-3-phosphate acyltransferase [bacterium ADurb.Bin243]|nr:MAG: 1-acyl-sn-glycerol-3-phosphate acyltransferase [bacterium ADurb.Bin243]
MRTEDIYFAIFRRVVRFLFAVFFIRYEIEGEENLEFLAKDKVGAVFASNHISNLDPILYMLVETVNIRFLAKNSLFRVPVLGWCIRKCGQLSVNRSAADSRAIRSAIDYVSRGQALCIFPEGTRSADGELLPGKPGCAMIAYKTKAVVIPSAIWGSHEILPKNKYLPRLSKVKIKIGKPIHFDDYYSKIGGEDENEREAYDLMTGKIMNEIRELHESIRRTA